MRGYQFHWMNLWQNVHPGPQTIMHNMIDLNVSVHILTHPFGTSDTSCAEDYKSEEKMERAEYAVEGQASHTDERYLFIKRKRNTRELLIIE